jgi:hypothetical protein
LPNTENSSASRSPGSGRSYKYDFMNRIARSVSYVFHPLIMPTVGLLLILNSGTYLALLDPAAKRAVIFVMALGTLLFPLLLLPVLYYRDLTETIRGRQKEENLVPQLLILVLYVITFIYFTHLPLSRVIHGYILSAPLVLLVLMVVNLRFGACPHLAALGGIIGLIITLIILYRTPLEGFLVISLVAAGLTGSARLASGAQKPFELLTGFILGFAVVTVTLLVY